MGGSTCRGPTALGVGRARRAPRGHPRPRRPSGDAMTGLRSTSRMSSRATMSSPSATRSRATASTSIPGRPRSPCRIAAPWRRSMSRRARSRSIGARATATSSRTSARIPPSPTRTAGPNTASRRAPTMSSTPGGAIGWTRTPRTVAPAAGPAASTASVALRIASASVRPSRTPPMSDLCARPRRPASRPPPRPRMRARRRWRRPRRGRARTA